MPFELPVLPYVHRALEPHIDARTMELHHEKHHQGYVSNLNKAIAGTALDSMPIATILNNVSQHGAAVRNHGGGHYNHTLFWSILSPQSGALPSGGVAAAIDQHFGGFDRFKETFTSMATTWFGSGWVWLYVGDHGKLSLCATPNQDNPLMDVVPAEYRGIPILGLDIWEHAYYLHYQHRRPEYIAAFWHLVNWAEVERRFQQAL